MTIDSGSVDAPGKRRTEGARREPEFDRLDRNLSELLSELRVALPGVQVLFAFLLIVPFSNGWSRASNFDRRLYFAILLSTSLATVLLIAPTIHHRLLFRRRERRFLVETAHRLVEVGMFFLALAMTGAIALVTHIALGGTIATVVVSAAASLCFGAVWYVYPFGRRYQQRGQG